MAPKVSMAPMAQVRVKQVVSWTSQVGFSSSCQSAASMRMFPRESNPPQARPRWQVHSLVVGVGVTVLGLLRPLLGLLRPLLVVVAGEMGGV